MSIAPPSDIVLDVAQAADPQRLQEAQAKLARMSAGTAGATDFAAALGPQTPLPSAPPVRLPLYPMAQVVTTKPISPYQKFEAVLLQNLVDNILPRGDGLFGDAASSDINRSMLAEQLAVQIARSNRVGIARMLEKAHGPAGAATAGAQLAAARPVPSPDVALRAILSAPRSKE